MFSDELPRIAVAVVTYPLDLRMLEACREMLVDSDLSGKSWKN